MPLLDGNYATSCETRHSSIIIGTPENDVTFERGFSHRDDGMNILNKVRISRHREILVINVTQDVVFNFGLFWYERVSIPIFHSLNIGIEIANIRV